MRTFMAFLFIFIFSFVSNADTELADIRPYSIESQTKAVKASLNGKVISEESIAWAQSVLIELYTDGKHSGSCSGAIIAQDTILTAAHCITGKVDKAVLYFGVKKTNERMEYAGKRETSHLLPYVRWKKTDSVHIPSKSKTNPNPYLSFNRRYYNNFKRYYNSLRELDVFNTYGAGFSQRDREDIALIFFKGGLPRGFSSADLYYGKIPAFKENVYTYGYGLNSREVLKFDRILREGETKVFSYYVTNSGTPLFFRSFSGGHSSSNLCAGDSGGGTYAKNKESGKLELIAVVVNSANGCANSQGHLIINTYQNWITKSIEEYRASVSL